MKTVVFCNLGTRDVEIPAEKPERTPSARAYGAAITGRLADGGLAPDDLAFPILKPSLDYILRRADNHIDHLIFVGTDQLESVAEHFRSSDTLYYAQLAAAVLVPRYGDKITQVSVALIGMNPAINPNNYDDTLKIYGSLMRQYAPDAETNCFLLASGGIPACNTALLLHGVWQFGAACQVIYQSEGGSPWALQVGQKVMAVMSKQTAVQFLDRFEFASAHNVLPDSASDPIGSLLQYASCRLWFDFKGADAHLDQAMRSSDFQTRQKLEPISRSLDVFLTEPGSKAEIRQRDLRLIAEVYHNALAAWENGRYIDYLGRAVRFYEAVLCRLAADLYEDGRLPLNLPADSLIEQTELRFMLLSNLNMLAQAETPVAVGGMVQLRRDLEESFNLEELKTLTFDLNIRYENLSGDTLQAKTRELVDYALRNGRFNDLLTRVYQERPRLSPPEMDRNGRLQVITPILYRLEQLVPLRAKSIIAHGYTGISRTILRHTYNGNETEEYDSSTQDMYEICVALGIQTENPFVQIQSLLKEMIAASHD